MGVTFKFVRKTYQNLNDKITGGPDRVKIGFPAGEAAADEVAKAVWNEFGTRGGASGGGWGGPVPERPFMRNAFNENVGRYKAGMASAAKKIIVGQTTKRAALEKLGIAGAADVQAAITSLDSPPNSPVTIALKGSNKPLIDSGKMRQAATFKVVK